MNISSAILKPLLKKISHSKSDAFLIDTDEGCLVAADNDLIIRVSDPALKTGGGKAVLPLRKTISFLLKLSGNIDYSMQEHKVTFKSGKTTGTIETVQQEFEVPKSREAGAHFNTQKLRQAVAFVTKSTGEKSNPFSNGVFIDGQNIVALDGKRMSIAEFQKDLENPIQLPLVAAQALGLFESTVVGVSSDFSSVSITNADVEIIAKKFTQSFPDYKQIIPDKFQFSGIVQAEDFLALLDRVSPLVEEKNGARPVKLTFNGTLQVSVADAVQDEIEYELRHPDPIFEDFHVFETVLDCQHLADFFGAVKGPVQFNGRDAESHIWLDAGNKKFLVSRCRCS